MAPREVAGAAEQPLPHKVGCLPFKLFPKLFAAKTRQQYTRAKDSVQAQHFVSVITTDGNYSSKHTTDSDHAACGSPTQSVSQSTAGLSGLMETDQGTSLRMGSTLNVMSTASDQLCLDHSSNSPWHTSEHAQSAAHVALRQLKSAPQPAVEGMARAGFFGSSSAPTPSHTLQIADAMARLTALTPAPRSCEQDMWQHVQGVQVSKAPWLDAESALAAAKQAGTDVTPSAQRQPFLHPTTQSVSNFQIQSSSTQPLSPSSEFQSRTISTPGAGSLAFINAPRQSSYDKYASRAAGYDSGASAAQVDAYGSQASHAATAFAQSAKSADNAARALGHVAPNMSPGPPTIVGPSIIHSVTASMTGTSLPRTRSSALSTLTIPECDTALMQPVTDKPMVPNGQIFTNLSTKPLPTSEQRMHRQPCKSVSTPTLSPVHGSGQSKLMGHYAGMPYVSGFSAAATGDACSDGIVSQDGQSTNLQGKLHQPRWTVYGGNIEGLDGSANFSSPYSGIMLSSKTSLDVFRWQYTNPSTGMLNRAAIDHLSAFMESQSLGSMEDLGLSDLQFIARGAYGVVYRGLWHGSRVAVKLMTCRNNREKAAQHAMELLMSKTLAHPNVVQGFSFQILQLPADTFDNSLRLEELLDGSEGLSVGTDVVTPKKLTHDIASSAELVHATPDNSFAAQPIPLSTICLPPEDSQSSIPAQVSATHTEVQTGPASISFPPVSAQPSPVRFARERAQSAPNCLSAIQSADHPTFDYSTAVVTSLSKPLPCPAPTTQVNDAARHTQTHSSVSPVDTQLSRHPHPAHQNVNNSTSATPNHAHPTVLPPHCQGSQSAPTLPSSAASIQSTQHPTAITPYSLAIPALRTTNNTTSPSPTNSSVSQPTHAVFPNSIVRIPGHVASAAATHRSYSPRQRASSAGTSDLRRMPSVSELTPLQDPAPPFLPVSQLIASTSTSPRHPMAPVLQHATALSNQAATARPTNLPAAAPKALVAALLSQPAAASLTQPATAQPTQPTTASQAAVAGAAPAGFQAVAHATAPTSHTPGQPASQNHAAPTNANTAESVKTAAVATGLSGGPPGATAAGLPGAVPNALATYPGRPARMSVSLRDSFEMNTDTGAVTRESVQIDQVINSLGLQPGEQLMLVIMEECDRGTLHAAIKHGCFRATPRWCAKTALRALVRTAREIAQGMRHLHSHGIIHADLKPSNVLLKSCRMDKRGFCAKVSDFGLSRIVSDMQPCLVDYEMQGTVPYMAPEVFDGIIMLASDVYSFGVLLWQMMVGRVPFEGVRSMEMVMGLVSAEQELAFPDSANPTLAAIGRRCLSFNAAQRPTFNEVTKMLMMLESELIAAEVGMQSMSF